MKDPQKLPQLLYSHLRLFFIFQLDYHYTWALRTMTFLKTSKNIRKCIFHKIIKLIVKDSFKYLGHMGQKTNWSVIFLLHTIQFLKTRATSASFTSLGRFLSVILSLIMLVIMGRYESQNCLRILAPWHVTFLSLNLWFLVWLLSYALF